MGQLLHILLAVVALTLVETFDASGLPLPALVLALLPVPHALGHETRRQGLHGRFALAALLHRALVWSPLALHLIAVTLLGWHASVLAWFEVETNTLGWPHPSLSVSLLPFVAFSLLAIDARARLTQARADDVARRRALQTRMFLMSISPLALIVALSSLLALDRELRVQVEEVALYNAAFGVVLLAVAAASVPALLKRTWDTVPMPAGPRRLLLEEVARRARFACRDLLEWRTGNQEPNAIVVGLTSRLRYVVFSDALLLSLGPRQLAAVFAHEIGHVQRRHFALIVGWTLACFFGAHAVTLFGAPDDAAALPFVAAVGLAWYLLVGWLGRRSELDADLFAVELTGDTAGLTDALERVTGAHARHARSWRHPSVAERVLFLRASERDPGVALRLRRTLRSWGLAAAALLVAAVAAEAWALVDSFAVDRVAVELRLGRYERAWDRLAAVPADDVPDEVRSAAELGRALALESGEGAVDEHVLEHVAAAALASGDVERARDALTLLALRERADAPAAALVASHLAAGEDEAAREAFDEVAEPWRELLEPLVPAPGEPADQ